MAIQFFGKRLTSFQIVIIGFLGLILVGTILLMLPISVRDGHGASFGDALFTSTSAVCVTGLVVKDTATYWTGFGQAVILTLIQIGGLGIVSVAAFIAMISGRKISLFQRSMLQESFSAHQIGGIVRMTGFIFKIALIVEASGALLMMPAFCRRYGVSGVWPAVFHSVSAFCNAGFDIMGDKTRPFSSLTSFAAVPGIIIPIVLLIVIGGIGFLTWEDIAMNRLHFGKYRMQSKVVLVTTGVLILCPLLLLFMFEYPGLPAKDRFFISLFQAITPRTAGFNTADLSSLSGAGSMLMIILMLIGGSPGSTAGGMKTTTAAVILANAFAVFRRRKAAELFRRRIEDNTIRNAATLFAMYLTLPVIGGVIVSMAEALPLGSCLFETASAIGTVGLSMGITPSLSLFSRLILILLMFLGRVGGLTIIYATVNSKSTDVSQRPLEKIVVG
ncbi:MAG: Trk family potassium uptake protein [Ruminococcaceae bacterium]|nr:Trk family potassium uptake protein [Oscillospiraceae bacterium]